MRFRKKDERNFIKVGFFISALTAVLMIMIVSIGKENSIFHPKIAVKAQVDNVKNLKRGSYVELKGIKVGTVSDINIVSEDQVEIIMDVLESQIQWIKKDSKVAISTAGLVGDKYLEIFSGSKDAPAFDPKQDILQSGEGTDFKQIINKGESIASLTERILSRLDAILLNMDDGKKIVETINSMNKASLNIEKITEELKAAQLGATVKNVNMSMARLDKASMSLEKILSRVEQGPGTMNSLIYDDSLHDDLRSLLGGASRNKVIKYFIRESIKNSERKKSKTDE
jgi:phospholipid/cholesterol/gamma-HCH transport system substrate-binding protein